MTTSLPPGFGLPTSLPKAWPKNEVVGIFSDASLQSIIDRAGREIAARGHENGVIVHVNGTDANVSVIKQIGSVVSIEAVLDYNYKQGLSGEFAVLASW